MPNAIDSKTKRDKLTPRRDPYWEPLKKGAAVGYRRLDGDGEGTWVARWRDDDGKQKYRALGNFKDFDVAAKAARAWVESCEQGASPKVTTVKQVCEAYIAALIASGRAATAKDAEGRFSRLIFNESIGKLAIDKLKTTSIQKWMNDQIDDDDESDDEDMRRSKDSANRNLATFKAALNMALRNRLVATDAGWKTVLAFPKVAQRRQDAFLSMDQRTALLNACPDDLKLLVKAMLLIGSRPGELASLNAGDFNKSLGCLTLTGKTGRRTVAISTAASRFFSECCKDKLPAAPMLTTSFSQRWNKDSWKKVFKAAVDAAELPHGVVLYALRHTAISEMILAGMDSFIVAKLAGTSVAMIEANYGHLKHSVVTAKLDAVAMF
ncbi:MAG: tyrosine-type recombinase/integrase [Rhodocyclaceae bacterium]|nr:tyrosine-type recombinase/integrase [Rhodocyclaceae bacterium]